MNKRRKRTKFIFTTLIVLGGLLVLTLLCPFHKENERLSFEFNVSDFINSNGFVVDNTHTLQELLTTEYTLEELEMYFGKHSSIGAGIIKDKQVAKTLSWDDVNLTFPVECLRYYKNTHYSVYKVKDGGLFYVFWMVPLRSTPSKLLDQDCPIRVRFSIYLNVLASVESFKPIKKMSTALDVFKRDAQMQIDFSASSGVYSYNLLNNGKVLEIKYTYDNLDDLNDLIIEEYKFVLKKDSTSAISCIEEFDLP